MMIEKRDFKGPNNPNWRGGVSKNPDGSYNHYRYKARKRLKHREMIKAHKKVAYAVKTGKRVRQPCQVCGELKVQAHHEDYAKPLDVQWYCAPHHREKDAERRMRMESGQEKGRDENN